MSLKILHVIETMAPRYGGPVGVLKSLSEAQIQRGHEVTIVTTNADCPAGVLPVVVNTPIKAGNITTYYFAVQFRPLNLSFPMARALSNQIAANDITHIHGLYRFPPSFAAWQARRQGAPYIIRPFGSLDPYMYAQSSKSVMLKRMYEKLFDLPNLRAAGAVHFTTEEERDRTNYLALETPSFVISNGLDWGQYDQLPPPGAFRKTLGIGPDTPLVLFLGRLNFKKGLDLLVPAFAKIKQSIPNATLAIIGPDNDGYGVKVREMVSARNLQGAVNFVDMLTGEAVRQAYVDADVFVLPSYTENFGMTVIEALACGTPTVISDQVNIHREVNASGGGVVVPCDIDQIADAVGSLLRDRLRCLEMGKSGRSWVQKTYTWESIVDRFDEEYRSVIARARR